MKTKVLEPGNRVLIYGTGNFAKKVAACALELGLQIIGFTDHRNNIDELNLDGKRYRVYEKNEVRHGNSFDVLILGIGNGYADLVQIYNDMSESIPKDCIFSPVEFSNYCGSQNLDLDCYWMQSNSNYYKNNSVEIEEMLGLFQDNESRELYLRTIKYREFGEILDLIQPDPISDHYLPGSLETPPKSLRMIDLGACRGENLEYFLDKGHTIDFGAFFEPDFSNFEFLAEKLRRLQINNSLVLPLAAWSETKLLTFDSSSDTSSHLSDVGDSYVQSVKLADFLATTEINYIKMDIEGAEYDALLGLESIIQRDRPHLAISVYHKPDDMWKIGLWLNAKFCSMYSFYLRTYCFQTFETVLYAIPNN